MTLLLVWTGLSLWARCRYIGSKCGLWFHIRAMGFLTRSRCWVTW
jgi:hypothetical protein